MAASPSHCMRLCAPCSACKAALSMSKSAGFKRMVAGRLSSTSMSSASRITGSSACGWLRNSWRTTWRAISQARFNNSCAMADCIWPKLSSRPCNNSLTRLACSRPAPVTWSSMRCCHCCCVWVRPSCSPCACPSARACSSICCNCASSTAGSATSCVSIVSASG